MIYATRYHDFCYGHRVYQHESKCQQLHGHGGRVHFTVEAEELDLVGRVLDFAVINTLLCQWVEKHWDHRFLIWEGDPWGGTLMKLDSSVRLVSFNPTAENMANYLLTQIGPKQLEGTYCRLVSVTLEETRKCSATAQLEKVNELSQPV